MNKTDNRKSLKEWQYKVHEVIFESHTFYGKLFDVCLLIAICTSVGIVMLDSMPRLHARFGFWFYIFEWVFTILFTAEYILRLMCIRKPLAYALSPMGIIDLVAILPTYLSFLVLGSQYLMVVRALRLLRVFRIFKLWHFLDESRFLLTAIYSSLRKISVFLLFIIVTTIIIGSIMYLIEGGKNGFVSIPDSIYWAVVTITTVGYGDISPGTPVGKLLAILLMLCGYAIIAVPTGIVTSEIAARNMKKDRDSRLICPNCKRKDKQPGAKYCRYCGTELQSAGTTND